MYTFKECKNYTSICKQITQLQCKTFTLKCKDYTFFVYKYLVPLYKNYKGMKKILTTRVSEVLDKETGELLHYESQKVHKEKINSENFYMVFLDYMSPLFKLNSDAARKILDKFCQMAEFNSGVVHLATHTRKELCEELNMSAAQFTNCIKKLKDLNLITGESGLFTINPYIFWKGDQNIRRQELLNNKAFQITYEIVDADE